MPAIPLSKGSGDVLKRGPVTINEIKMVAPTGFATLCNFSGPWRRLSARGVRFRGFGTPAGSVSLTSSTSSELDLPFEGAAISG
jgi:hypothetical protein